MAALSDASMVILTPRGRGRPKTDEPGTTLTAWVPTREYDRLLKMANAREQSLSALVRDLLTISRAPAK